MENEIELTCDECGEDFKRPEEWRKLNANVFFRYKLKYCDKCYKLKIEAALLRLPDVISAFP